MGLIKDFLRDEGGMTLAELMLVLFLVAAVVIGVVLFGVMTVMTCAVIVNTACIC